MKLIHNSQKIGRLAFLVSVSLFATNSIGQSGSVSGHTPVSSALNSNLPMVTLSDVLKKFRERSSTSSIEKSLDKKSSAQIEKDTRRFPGAWTIGVASERPYRTEGESKLEVNLKKSIALGIDRSSIVRRYQAEKNADIKSALTNQRERELQVTKLFLQLKKTQEMSEILRSILASIEPLEKNAKAAARLGTLGGFYATQVRLMVDGLRSDLRHNNNAFAAKAKAMASVTGLELPKDPAQSKLFVPDLLSQSNTAVTESSYLPVSADRNRQESLTAMASQISSAWEIEAGIGVSRNLETNETGVKVELSMPLGSRSAAKSEVRSIESEKEALKAQTDYLFDRARDEMSILTANIDRLFDAVKIERSRITELESLLASTQSSFSSGQGDLAEVVETIKELLNVKTRFIEIKSELAEASAELGVMTKGELN